MKGKLTAVLLALLTAGALAVHASAAATATVRLSEWKVVPSAATVPAGKVTFVVRNVGRIGHNLVVLRTTRAPSKLPVAGGRAREMGRVGATPVFGPGKTRRLTLTLRAGMYVLICNVPGHYRAGMFVGFRAR